jgi:hypothetical protein
MSIRFVSNALCTYVLILLLFCVDNAVAPPGEFQGTALGIMGGVVSGLRPSMDQGAMVPTSTPGCQPSRCTVVFQVSHSSISNSE